MNTPVSTFLAVLETGGRFAPADGDKLRVMLPADCSADLKDAIRAHKDGLLALLAGPPFIVVRSDVTQPDLLLWVATDRDRDFLISLGAPAGAVYTRDELRAIVNRNPDADTMTLLHRTKRTFGGRVFADSGCNPNLQPDRQRPANER